MVYDCGFKLEYTGENCVGRNFRFTDFYFW